MKSTLSITSRQLMLRELHDYLMIALGLLFYAIGWTVFLLPNDITTGGVPGIASIVYWATGLNVQYTYFAINGGLLIASLIVLGWKFSVKTIFAVFVMTTILPIIQNATAGLHLLGNQPFMWYGYYCCHYQQIQGYYSGTCHSDDGYDHYFFQLFCPA